MAIWRFEESGVDYGQPIIGEYDIYIVVISVLIACVASYTALTVANRMSDIEKMSLKYVWLAVGSTAMGLGIWAMHFTGMLAFSMDMPVGYSLPITILSGIPAIVGSAVALLLLSTKSITWQRNQVSAACLALCIGLMHYIGMEAMRMPSILKYDAFYFVLSIVVAHALASLALYFKYVEFNESSVFKPYRNIISAIAMGLSVSGMHYTAMGATRIYVSDVLFTYDNLISDNALLLSIIIITSSLLIVVIVVAYLDKVFNQLKSYLYQSENKFQNLVEGSLQGIFVHKDFKPIFTNQRCADIFGYSNPGEILELDSILEAFWSSDEQDRIRDYQIRRMEGGETPDSYECRGRRKDGSLFWFENYVTVVDWQGEKVIQATVIDITERKQAEDALRESEERFRAAFTDAAIGMVMVSLDQSTIETNQAFCNMLGYSEEELVGLSSKDITHPDDADTSSDYHQRLITGKINDYHLEKRYLHKQGHVIWASLSVSLVRDKDTTPLYAIAQIQDITERKKAEKEIVRFSRIFEDSLNEIYLLDVVSLKFIQVNSAALHNLGYSMEELREMAPPDINSDFTTESLEKLITSLRKGEKGIIVSEGVHQRKDKSLYDVEIHLQLLSHEQDELIVAIIMDITDKKKQESILHQAQKMEAVGQLTGGIAHDFNNLLSIISGNLRFLKEDIGETSEAIDELFEDAMSAANDGAELTQRLLGFSRTKILHPETRNVNETIEKSVRFLARTLADNTELATVLPDEMLYINVDPSQLENALLNLCINARDAMAEGGTITISAERYYHGSDDTDDYSLSLPEGDYVKISVSDTGTGISPEDMQHVYEPFFTTKDVGKGSGLGLSMVFGFTQQSQGACHIDSTLGKGTTVSMYFPEVAEHREIARTPKDVEELASHGSEVILVVEDDPRVRRVALRELEKLGYQILEAENAELARTIIESGEHIDLLFSDVLMPGEMDGHMLALWTEEHYPQIKIVLTSGYTKGKTEVREDKAHLFPLLRKPYTIDKLAEQIKIMLAELS